MSEKILTPEETRKVYSDMIPNMEEHLIKEKKWLEDKLQEYNRTSHWGVKNELNEEIIRQKWAIENYEKKLQQIRKLAGRELPQVEVIVANYSDFLDQHAKYELNIDSYQRPYVWDEEKIEELIKDLEEYLEQNNGLSYFMGTILLHNNSEKEKLFIIDGQQRLTTLSILYFILNQSLHEKLKMTYNSPLSAQNIKKAQAIFQKIEEKFKAKNLFNKIEFTFIITDSEDLAFTFFDTQNNRGVKLDPTDLLKAFHLRVIGNADYIDLQTDCAERWEKIQTTSTLFGNKDFLAELFNQFLWRSRKWVGQKVIHHERDELIRYEFEKNTTEPLSPYEVKLYPNALNSLGKKLEIKVKEGYLLQPNSFNISNRSANLPFTLRQPISKGLGFFLFTEKYADLVNILFFDTHKSSSPEILAVRDFYHSVWKNLSIYLKEIFVLSILMYFDKYQTNGLLEFVLRLDDSLGAIRFQKQYIFKQATLLYLKDCDSNLLDVISLSFRPEEIIDFLKRNTNYNDYLKDFEKKNGVQAQYKDKLEKYYNRKDFDQKKNWITAELIQQKTNI